MPTAHSAALIVDPGAKEASERLRRLFEFFELPWRSYSEIGELAASSDPAPRELVSLFAPLSCLGDLVDGEGKLNRVGRDLSNRLHSAFFYLSGNPELSQSILQKLLGHVSLLRLGRSELPAKVSSPDASLTGPLEGITAQARTRPFDYILTGSAPAEITPLITTELGPSFFEFQLEDLRCFVSCSTEIVDLDGELKKTCYDVRDQFLSAAPLVMYLKWSLRDVSWKLNETGACFIVDDPLLRSRYGFCDFPVLDQQMQEHSFTTCIAMIPWNNTRTSPAMAALMKGSNGRLSACVHGCDHTQHEFGTVDASELNYQTTCALERMDAHRKLTGINHDRVMIFPQGVFSRDSLKVLQEHQFLAAVNTDAVPVGNGHEALRIRDTWKPAIVKHSSFPLFTRRYPSHGLENFAFDLLLNRPCLIVEHHRFYRNKHREVIRFVRSLNALKAELHWRSLGEVIRRCYLTRERPDGVVEVQMFANELLLTNGSDKERSYEIRKADENSAGVRAVKASDTLCDWRIHGGALLINLTLPAGASRNLRVEYSAASPPARRGHPLTKRTKVAARRYLSEFRDNVLARNDGVMKVAGRAKALVRGKALAK